ncbi:nuclear transport factor 2 family protein [Litorivivens sp.]|uniref:nuclear transport factor 2 family protein n=1 Tax=Litorivivens sp. TaxID=2020868 RepID=UPI0035621341
MLDIPENLHPAVAQSLTTWHDMVERADLKALESIVHPEATFRSPMSINPYAPAEALVMALSTVITVFENLTYHRQFASDDGLNVVLEFSADVGDRSVKGIDMIRFDEQGLITDFEVMIRPFNGLQALGAAMAARIGDKLPSFKVRK